MTCSLTKELEAAVARADWAAVGDQLPTIARHIAELEQHQDWTELRRLADSIEKVRQLACVQRAHCAARLQEVASCQRYSGSESPSRTFACEG